VSISLLKQFLEKHAIKLNEEDEEDLIGDETDVLKVTNIDDSQNDKINIQYTYSYEVEETQFSDIV